MPPVVCIVGASDSGKTTFLEKLIPELVRRGYRIGTIKHDAHSFEMDREGKDTWRHRKAGAQTIAITSPNQTATIYETNAEMDLEEAMERFFWREDLVLTEGYKRSQRPKIEIFRKAVEPQPICGTHDNLIALVSDDLQQASVPVFPVANVMGVADLIENRYLKDRRPSNVLVKLDGHKLPANDFVKDFIVGTIVGMLGSLRGWKKPRIIDIHIELE
jgi:molybdopterin-guanine dinucleotide biosynthesis adapter protein